MIVVDASFVGPLILPDEQENISPDRLREVLASPLLVPMHWHLEVANMVRQAIRRGRIDPAIGLALLEGEQLIDPQIDRHTLARAWTVTLPLAQRHDLTTYDAAYLELAMRRDLPLATLDRALAAAARSEGIALA